MTSNGQHSCSSHSESRTERPTSANGSSQPKNSKQTGNGSEGRPLTSQSKKSSQTVSIGWRSSSPQFSKPPVSPSYVTDGYEYYQNWSQDYTTNLIGQFSSLDVYMPEHLQASLIDRYGRPIAERLQSGYCGVEETQTGVEDVESKHLSPQCNSGNLVGNVNDGLRDDLAGIGAQFE